MMDKIIKNGIRIVFYILIDVVIVLLVIQAFIAAYNFSYKVFTDQPGSYLESPQVQVVIPPDSSTAEIVDILIDSDVVEDKYVMLAKIYISSYHGKLMPGTYVLSKTMTQSEILKILTHTEDEESGS